MKLGTNQIDGFVRKPPAGLRAALVFGEDAGLVRERVDALAKSVVVQLDDPFLVAELTGEQVAEEPARLAEEAAAIAMTGGRRVVLVRDAGDKAIGAFKDFVEDPVGDALVIAWAGALASKSALRKLFESAANHAAAVPCYMDDAGAVARLIDERLKVDGVAIDPDAHRFLIDHLGSDRAMSRSEIEKLALYAGPGGRLTLEDVTAAVGDSAATALDDVIYAAADGRSDALDRAIEQGFALGLSAIPMVRQTAAHLMRLRQMRGAVDAGRPPKSVVDGARPPVFWKNKDPMTAQLTRLDADTLAEALTLALEAEAQCKRSGAPDQLVASRALHQIAALARRAGAKGRR
ncbi:MAG: DNA polymerase III subunit delta [Marivibrio sp.]|uniref:DNA polymerase III subunit delta n=1 Tax=Marivibrio sp. TaxID=2039719 RepID=UPI0032F07FBE